MRDQKLLIKSNEQIAPNTFKMCLEGSMEDIKVEQIIPGQFIFIEVKGKYLRRPISICSVNGDKTLDIVYKVFGEGTKELSTYTPGVELRAIMPLGNGYEIASELEGQKVLIVGGGVGVPPMYELTKRLTAKNEVNVILGFNTKEEIFLDQEFANLAPTHVATMDGSAGTKGTPLDVVTNQGLEFDYIFACGPMPLLRAINEQYSNKKGYLSYEKRMACGVGACMGCVCHVENGQKRVCVDGPVFKIGEVVNE